MAKEFFNKEQQQKIVSAIQEAEMNTSGEVQLHLEDHCKEDAKAKAIEVFDKMEMYKTQQRNGVLFYLAVVDKKFAIVGDSGINSVVAPNFWDEIKADMSQKFKQGDFLQGICEGILKAGEQLKAHFPYQKGDVNELPDEISFGTNTTI